MNTTEVYAAVRQAKLDIKAVDEHVYSMGVLIQGRLKSLPYGYWNQELLKSLKKELSQFNATTGKWNK